MRRESATLDPQAVRFVARGACHRAVAGGDQNTATPPSIGRPAPQRLTAHDRRSVELANKATAAIRQRTGDLDDDTPYVRTELSLHGQTVITTKGFENDTDRRFSIFGARERVPGIGNVFVALFDSPQGFINGARQSTASGWHHTADSRLDELLDSLGLPAEDGEGRLPLDLGASSPNTPVGRCAAAADIAYRIEANPSAPAEALIEVHARERDVTIPGAGHVDLALVGTPLWVARHHEVEASGRWWLAPDAAVGDDEAPLGSSGWAIYEEALVSGAWRALDRARDLDLPPDLPSWFVLHAERFGPDPVALQTKVRHFDERRKAGAPRGSWAPSDRRGWLLGPLGATGSYAMITTDGEVVMCDRSGRLRRERTPRTLVEEIFRTVHRFRTQLV